MDFHPRRTTGFLAALTFLLLPLSSLAQVHYAPQNCSPKELKLLVQNTAKSEESFWVQVYEREMINEIRITVPSGSSQSHAGNEWLVPGQAFTVKPGGRSLRFTLSCRGLYRMSPFTSPRWEFDVVRDSGPYFLAVQNLAQKEQSFELRYLNGFGATLHDLRFDFSEMMESQSIELRPPAGTSRIIVEGQGRLHAALLHARNGRQVPGRLWPPAKVAADPAKVYFQLSDPAGEESFVIALEDPQLIAQARDYVARGLQKLTIADIEPADGPSENRNFSLSDRSPWSWKVSRVIRFNDLASINCDGGPSVVEEFFSRWMNSPRRICFWKYHLKRELSAEEVSTGFFREELP